MPNKSSKGKKKVLKGWAVIPEHGECFSLVYDRENQAFSNAIFRTKTDARECKQAYDKREKTVKTQVVPVEILFTLPKKK